MLTLAANLEKSSEMLVLFTSSNFNNSSFFTASEPFTSICFADASLFKLVKKRNASSMKPIFRSTFLFIIAFSNLKLCETDVKLILECPAKKAFAMLNITKNDNIVITNIVLINKKLLRLKKLAKMTTTDSGTR